MKNDNDTSNNDISSFSSESKKESINNSRVKGYQYRTKKSFLDISNRSSNFFRLMWISMTFIISTLISHYFIMGSNDLLAVGRKESKEVTITIPKDATKSDVAKVLQENGVIKERGFFQFYTFLTRTFKNIIYGTFTIKTDLDYEAIINFLQSNSNRSDKDIVEVAFLEGFSVSNFADSLQKNNVCGAEEFIEKCSSDDFDESYEFLRSLPRKEDRNYKLEGFLFPDTYKFYKNSKPSDVIKKMLNNYERKIYSKPKDKNFKIIDKIKEKRYDINEILTLASIIQSEAASKEEMYMVSSVFRNRLNTIPNGGVSKFSEYSLNLLESDPTVWYPYKNRESVPKNIVETFKSKYDTYKNIGLPPGPICSPGINAIDAAINPTESDYYYFCHDKNKKGYFAKNKSGHIQNLKNAGLSVN